MRSTETTRLHEAIRESLRLQAHGQYLLERAEGLLTTQRRRHNEAEEVFGRLRQKYEDTMKHQGRRAELPHADAMTTEDRPGR